MEVTENLKGPSKGFGYFIYQYNGTYSFNFSVVAGSQVSLIERGMLLSAAEVYFFLHFFILLKWRFYMLVHVQVCLHMHMQVYEHIAIYLVP